MKALRSVSVQSKMLLAFVLLTLVAIGVVSWIGYASARDSLRATAEQQLMGISSAAASSSTTCGATR